MGTWLSEENKIEWCDREWWGSGPCGLRCRGLELHVQWQGKASQTQIWGQSIPGKANWGTDGLYGRNKRGVFKKRKIVQCGCREWGRKKERREQRGWVGPIPQGLRGQVWPLCFVVKCGWKFTGGFRQVSDMSCLCFFNMTDRILHKRGHTIHLIL